jgi:hypothetical protein
LVLAVHPAHRSNGPRVNLQKALVLAITCEAILATNGRSTAHFIPLGVDAVVAAGRFVDIGPAFPSPPSAGTAPPKSQFINHPGYGDILMGILWVRLRT